MTGVRPRTVLVVDDDPDVSEMVRTVLEGRGYETVSAENGKKALDWLQGGAARPSMILLDLMMPVMNGWQFQKAKAADPALAPIPMAIITALANDAGRKAELGAVDVLAKPSRIEALMETVDRLCR